MINNYQKENEDKRREKNYTITLDTVPRRKKLIKEKKLYQKRKKEMLQDINFDYLNLFKKLFEINPDNLLHNDINNNLKDEKDVNKGNKLCSFDSKKIKKLHI